MTIAEEEEGNCLVNGSASRSSATLLSGVKHVIALLAIVKPFACDISRMNTSFISNTRVHVRGVSALC